MYRKKDNTRIINMPLNITYPDGSKAARPRAGTFTPEQMQKAGYYEDVTVPPDTLTHVLTGVFAWDDGLMTVTQSVRPLTSEELALALVSANKVISQQRESRYIAETDEMEHDLKRAERSGETVDWTQWLDIQAQIRLDLPYKV